MLPILHMQTKHVFSKLWILPSSVNTGHTEHESGWGQNLEHFCRSFVYCSSINVGSASLLLNQHSTSEAHFDNCYNLQAINRTFTIS